jgi:hypothetical protein
MVEKKSADTGRETPIKIQSKDGKQVGTAMPRAFERVWKERGWTRVDDKSSGDNAPATTSKKEQG